MSPKYIWHNGSLRNLQDSGSPILAHALHYGTGVFEGIRAYDALNGPAVFRLDAHLDRMAYGASLLGMPFDKAEMKSAVFETMQANGHRAAYIRPVAYYATGGLGLDVEPLKAHYAVATLPWKSHLGSATEDVGVRVQRSPYYRISSKAVPSAKLCGVYVNSVIAKRHSTLMGFDEALFVDGDGYVCECTGENVFAIFNGEVVAVKHEDALDGITRATVMEMLGATERPVSYEELLTADEVFLTGTSAEVASVSCLGEREYGVGPMTRDIKAWYQDTVHGRESAQQGWLSWAA
jgi:branched-chain amino acid aminotransferase